MRIKFEQDPALEDVSVTVAAPSHDEQVKQIFKVLNAFDVQIKCDIVGENSGEQMVSVSDIYYFESLERKTFVYCKDQVMRTEKKLYQIQEDLKSLGFLQVSKSCVLNIKMLESVTTLPNSRLEGRLKNGESILISRKYLKRIKELLESGGTA